MAKWKFRVNLIVATGLILIHILADIYQLATQNIDFFQSLLPLHFSNISLFAIAWFSVVNYKIERNTNQNTNNRARVQVKFQSKWHLQWQQRISTQIVFYWFFIAGVVAVPTVFFADRFTDPDPVLTVQTLIYHGIQLIFPVFLFASGQIQLKFSSFISSIISLLPFGILASIINPLVSSNYLFLSNRISQGAGFYSFIDQFTGLGRFLFLYALYVILCILTWGVFTLSRIVARLIARFIHVT